MPLRLNGWDAWCTANTGNHIFWIWHITSRLRPKRFMQTDRFKYFNTVVTPVAVFGAANRKVYKQDLPKMDIVFRRLLPSTIGPLGDLDWTEQLAKRQFQLAAEVSAEQFWSSVARIRPQQLGGILIFTACPACKRGRPHPYPRNKQKSQCNFAMACGQVWPWQNAVLSTLFHILWDL